MAADEEFRQRFLRDSRAAAAVDDPHIIPVYEAGEADGVLFISMRYLSGGEVKGLLRREGPLSPARAAASSGPAHRRRTCWWTCGRGSFTSACEPSAPAWTRSARRPAAPAAPT
jgi:hypothetical protein